MSKRLRTSDDEKSFKPNELVPIQIDLNNNNNINNRKSPTVMAPIPAAVTNPIIQGNRTVVKIESIMPMDYEDESTSQSYTSSNLDMSTSSSSKQHLSKSFLSGDSRLVRPAPTLATGRKSKDAQVRSFDCLVSNFYLSLSLGFFNL